MSTQVSKPEVRRLIPNPDKYGAMDQSLVGSTVAFCLNKKSILPARVLVERAPIGDEKRLDLEVSFLTRDKMYEDDDDDGGPGFDSTKEKWVFTPHTKKYLNVRFYDPTVARERDPQTGRRTISRDEQGKPIKVPLQLFNSEPGTWFFIDRYRFQLHFHRHEIVDRSGRRARREVDEYHPSADSFYDNWNEAWDMIQRQSMRGKVPGTFWDDDSMQVKVEEKQ